ncbi:hypothetical protein GYMLUDRAFT_55238 [Collybiopsis luxurians FD-317 M1]|nr:hypothetical protein GYMLUDRAFT_55238 [Collybiopsis luxurians FD-317 M1]
MSPSLLRKAKPKSEDTSPVETSPSKSFFKRTRKDSKIGDKSSGRDILKATGSKGKHKLNTSDNTLILDISAENAAILRNASQMQLSNRREFASTPEHRPLERSHSPPLVIDNELLDQFPLPPIGQAYTSREVRIAPPLPPEELLPPLHPRVKRYIAEMKAEGRKTPRRQPLERSFSLERSSSVSSFSRPTATAYPSLLQNSAYMHAPSPAPSSQTAWSTHGRKGSTYGSQTQSRMNRSSPHLLRPYHNASDRPLLPRKSQSDLSSLDRPAYRTEHRWASTGASTSGYR